jgi:UDP-N-acetylmuramyl pentapeptide phosphotransferase/UDP-N-acetylglucosamine-1-phosphate transferase
MSLVILVGVGMIDDYFPDLPGYFKPVGTMVAGLPLILLHTYKPNLAIFGGIVFHLPIVYPLLILVAFSVVPNSVNMLDVINGSAVTGVIFVLLSAIIGYYLKFNGTAILSIIFLAILAGFLIFNIYPAKIFLGNAGSLLLGYYVLLSAIFYRVEFLCLIAMFPFIHNSFFYLNKVKRFMEHKKLSAKVTYFSEEDELIYDACDDAAPLTLLRFLVSHSPKSEFESYLSMVIAFSLSSFLSIITLLVWG